MNVYLWLVWCDNSMQIIRYVSVIFIVFVFDDKQTERIFESCITTLVDNRHLCMAFWICENHGFLWLFLWMGISFMCLFNIQSYWKERLQWWWCLFFVLFQFILCSHEYFFIVLSLRIVSKLKANQVRSLVFVSKHFMNSFRQQYFFSAN